MCKKKDYIRLICSLLLKEKLQKKNTGHSVVDREKNLISSTRKCLKMASLQRELVTRQRKQFLRDAIDDAASTARSPEEFSKILDEKYHIIFKISRNRYSYLHPGRNISLEEILGTRYTEDFSLESI